MTLIEAYPINVLAMMVWREARGETFNAKLQVAWTVKNRVDNPKWWGHDWISVITKKWQYSSMGAPGDKQLILFPAVDDPIYVECLGIANFIINFKDDHAHAKDAIPFLHADSYYDDSIVPPKWATKDKRLGTIGHFTFYNIDGDTDD